MKPEPGYHLPAMASVRLFVYGSLKRGGRHHDQLAGAVFVGQATTLPGYRLEPLGEYLALVNTGPELATTVAGEVFEVDESKLSALDAFEGDAYERGKVRLMGEPSQKPGFALAYFRKAR
jgi:gamma-glutamylaminecyclotransferase